MIALCELGFPDDTHVPFNAGLLATIYNAFPPEQLVFYGSQRQIASLQQQVGRSLSDRVSWNVISPPPLGTPYFKRFGLELRIIRRLMANERNNRDRVLFTSAYPSTVLAIKAVRLLRPTTCPIQIVLHGLSGVVGRRYRRPIRRFQDMKTALMLLGNQGIQYLVLEDSIRNAVVKQLPSLAGNMATLDHPIAPNEGSTRPSELSAPIRFGFLGLAIESKGFPLFLALAKEMGRKFHDRAEFHAFGRTPHNGLSLNGLEALATKPAGKEMLTRTGFVDGLTSLHFILLLHEAGPYAITASGIMLDAIAWEKPVIARRIPIFESMFEKYGDIGYLFEDRSELEAIVEGLLQTPDPVRYRRQVVNLRNARQSRSPEALAVSYRAMCGVGVGAA